MLAQTPADELDAGPRRLAPGAERLCAATGVVLPVADMIRFVVAPDGTAVADLKRRLPGRGVWITATRQGLRTAIARKAFARSFKRPVGVPPDLVEATERQLEDAALAALAMAHKAGRVAIGFAKAAAAVTREPVVALLHAAEAAPDGVGKLKAATRRRFSDSAGGIAVLDLLGSAQLDLALGRSNVIHAALLAGPESKTFLARMARLDRFRTEGPRANPAAKG
jgi:predicted RNA-binding protein YlxR (DUF448 family)